MNIKKLLFDIGDAVFDLVQNSQGQLKNRVVSGYSTGGDAQFDIDDKAEEIVLSTVEQSRLPVALYTEAGELHKFSRHPEIFLIVDPIDGTRPAAASLEMSCVSIAAAFYREDLKIADIRFALLKELKTGAYLYADDTINGILSDGYKQNIPTISPVDNLKNMFWSFEFNGHPTELMIKAYGDIIDLSANTGGVFIFNSASYSISRIITGQLDAYVDIGNRILKDNPYTRPDFLKVGKGSLLHLFPYDIAASVYIAEKAEIVCTDAYGKSLKGVPLLSTGEEALSSCIAASNSQLHSKILSAINWKL